MILEQSFKNSNGGWCSYIYIGQGRTDRERNRFPLAKHDKEGYIWTDDSMWSIDTPENPNSIIPLMIYALTYKKNSFMLKETIVTFTLKGEDLDMKGGKLYFWICTPHTRWHFREPLEIKNDEWVTHRLHLINSEEVWRCSWYKKYKTPLRHALGLVDSFGFAFVGFEKKVTGKICMREFKIEEKDG